MTKRKAANIHRVVGEILRRHGVDEALANDLLCKLDEFYVEVWEGPDAQLSLRPVDLEGSRSRRGRAEREKLVELADVARKLALGLQRLLNADFRSSMRVAQIDEKLSPLSTQDVSERIRDFETAIRAVIADMGEPLPRRRGNRTTQDGQASIRMLGVLRAAGVTDDSKCAEVVADVLAAAGRGVHTSAALLKRFRRQK